MCRFVVYKGKKILLSELLTQPRHSLIKQSYDSKERHEPLNGDGFGIGWYVKDITDEPCVFSSVKPAWGNRNLDRLVKVVESNCIFAHIRAASPGLIVSETNCHPFQYQHLIWMHNGRIPHFSKIQRALRQELRDDLYSWITGTTDSEHAFALFLNFLPEDLSDVTHQDLEEALTKTIDRLNTLCTQYGQTETCFYNFAVTDGSHIFVTRYSTNDAEAPETLYYSQGSKFECNNGLCQMVEDPDATQTVVVASEPITLSRQMWKEVPAQHLMRISPDLTVDVHPLPRK